MLHDPIPPGVLARQFAGVLSDLAAIETPAMRFLRENADVIRRGVEEMEAERAAEREVGR